jgi:glyoxylase-like metal-dependent hydrolase (beta-lactamase superfamily II)
MALYRMEPVTDHISMIDIELFGIKRAGAVFLIRGGLNCLVDSGTPKEVKGLIRTLDSIGAFPPDILILTHSHWDHTQGTPILRREAEKRGKPIKVMASEKAIPNLEDQSWNTALDQKHRFENIPDVEALEAGQVVDLEGAEIEVIDFAGHCADDIAIYERKHQTLIAGDALGYQIEKSLMFPPFMPPFWRKEGFFAALKKARQLECEKLCLNHFGCLQGDEIQAFLDDTASTYETWWEIFADADKKGKLDDPAYLKDRILTAVDRPLPDLEVSKPLMRVMLSMINIAKKIRGKDPINVAEVQLEGIIGWLTEGYKGATGRA